MKLAAILLFFVIVVSCNNSPEISKDPKTDSTVNKTDTLLMSDSLKYSHIEMCTEMLPYPSYEFKNLYQIDTIENPNGKFMLDGTAYIFKPNKQPVKLYLHSLKGYIWSTNNLKVKFLDGDPNGVLVQRVINVAKEWEKYCAVKFTFGNFTDANIIVSFKGRGYKSYIGSAGYGRSPSMVFAGLNANMPSEEFNRIVLHEFGHALGFIHEHQVDGANIPWNYDTIYDFYKYTEGWDRQTVYDQIIKKYEFPETNSAVVDTNSIMMYHIPSEVTLNNYHVDWKNKLSVIDISEVKKYYH